MGRGARSALGTLGGLLWGAGVAVLLQQLAVMPLDAPLAYGAPAVAAVASAFWGRVRGGRPAGSAAFVAVALLLAPPATVQALQSEGCDAFINDQGLSTATAGRPIVIDPTDGADLEAFMWAPGLEGARGDVWIEFGGIRVFGAEGTVDGGPARFDLRSNGFGALGGAPGLYHVGGSVGGCSVDGYVEIGGNPFAGPIGPAASGAVAIGIALTWLAGRPAAAPSPIRRATTRGRLDPTGVTVRTGEVEIESPDLDGEIEVHEPTEVAIRDVAGLTGDTRDVLARHHMDVDRIIELPGTTDSTGAASGGPLVDHLDQPAFELRLPGAGPDRAQVVLACDESGVLGWHFPRLDSGEIDVARTGDVLRYRMARRVAPGAEADGTRGIAAAFGAKVLSSLVFPLLDPVFGRVGERLARSWETKARPYRLRTFTPDDYTTDEGREPDWDRMGAGKALLFVHGTFSRAHTGFAGIPPGLVAELHELYDGRVFAFDHFTLSDDPRRNVEWLYEHLPSGVPLHLDIISHSRGGLVSRTIAEKQEELGVADRAVTVEKIVFVGTPNAGTILTEPAYLGDLVDSYTNLLNFVPGPQLVDVFEGLVPVVKHIAVGALAGLGGLQAMRPGGEFLRWLNADSTNRSRYFAVAGDYEPHVEGWRRFAADRVMDGVFREANDLVVPTAGTFGANGSNLFPIDAPLELTGDDGVDHTSYFADPRVGQRLIVWLRR